MNRSGVLELLTRSVSVDLYHEIRDLWKRHSIAEDRRDIPGLLSTLTEDCVYEVFPVGRKWVGHAQAAEFYKELLSAIPDVKFELTDIVIGPQGVCEEAWAAGTHEGRWLHFEPSHKSTRFQVVIFFPWDMEKRLFRGEKVYVHGFGG